MSTELTLKKVTAYTVYSSDNEWTGSEKGSYKSSDIASVKAKGAGWYGSDGQVRVKKDVYSDEEGNLYNVTKIGKFIDELEKEYQAVINSIKSKLTPEELHLLGVK